MAQAIVYATEAETSKETAEAIGARTGISVFNVDSFSLDTLATYSLVIFVVPTYEDGGPPPSTADTWNAFLGSAKRLPDLKFAVWGMGSSDFDDSFVQFAKTLEAKLKELGASELTTLGYHDANEAQSIDLDGWVKTLGVPLS
jgi:flavodoxin